MKYKIEIKETLTTVEEIEANSKEEAIDKIQNKYYNQEIVLEPDSFNEVEFNVLEPERINEHTFDYETDHFNKNKQAATMEDIDLYKLKLNTKQEVDSIDVYSPKRFKEEYEKYNPKPEEWQGTIIQFPGVYVEIDETHEYKDGDITTDIFFYKTLEDVVNGNYIEGSGVDIYGDNFIENLNNYVENEFGEEEEEDEI